MSINKNALSIRKRPASNSIIPVNGAKILSFAHQASGGETSINLTSLTVPPSLVGFSNPSTADILGAHLSVYPSSMTLVSSLNGILQKDVTWQMSGPTTITLNSYTLTNGEIITGIIHATAANGVLVTDAYAIVATGTLTAGQDTIVTGPFVVNKYPTQQIGDVLVFINGVIQMRNVNNVTAAPSADGNYQELPVAGGLTNQVKLNNAVGVDTPYIVVSNGLVAERPTGSMLAAIEALQGKVDAMIPDLEAVTGNPAGTYGVAPTNVDLQSFGQTVLSLISRISKLETPPIQNTFTDVLNPTSGVDIDHPDGAKTVTLPIDGLYKVTVIARHTHSNTYTLVRGQWTFGGTATSVSDVSGSCEWTGAADVDGNGVETGIKTYRGTAGQTITIRPQYRVDYGGTSHAFNFGYLVERIGD